MLTVTTWTILTFVVYTGSTDVRHCPITVWRSINFVRWTCQFLQLMLSVLSVRTPNLYAQVECHWRMNPFVCCTQLHGMMTLVVDLQAMIIKNDILGHSYCVELYHVELVTGTTLRAADTDCSGPHSTSLKVRMTVQMDEDVDIVYPGARPCAGPRLGCIPSSRPVSSQC